MTTVRNLHRSFSPSAGILCAMLAALSIIVGPNHSAIAQLVPTATSIYTGPLNMENVTFANTLHMTVGQTMVLTLGCSPKTRVHWGPSGLALVHFRPARSSDYFKVSGRQQHGCLGYIREAQALYSIQ